MTTPKHRDLGQKLEAIRYWNWFSISKNRFRRKAHRALRRASRRESKREGRVQIQEQLADMETE